jgi:hypothetical protein
MKISAIIQMEIFFTNRVDNCIHLIEFAVIDEFIIK